MDNTDGTTYSLTEDLTLTCDFTGKDAGTVTWYKNDEDVSTNDRASSVSPSLVNNAAAYSLTVSNVDTAGDEGVYKCEMAFADGQKIDKSTRVVVRTAIVSNMDSDAKLTEEYVTDGTLLTRCVYTGSAIPSGTKWYDDADKEVVFDGIKNEQNNELLSANDAPVKVYQSAITLRGMTLPESGSYRCEFTMADGNSPTATVAVNVVSVSAEECVFLDYGTTTSQTFTCTLSASKAGTGIKFTLPGGSEVDGEMFAMKDNAQVYNDIVLIVSL